MTHFIYTKHARKRLKERNISEQLVEDIYYNPDDRLVALGESERALRYLDRFTVIVTYEKLKRKEEVIKIISVHKKKNKRT